jgi:hypothetical protein
MDHMRGTGPRITDPAALVAAERTAHAAEWAAVTTGPDPVARFAEAQTQLGAGPLVKPRAA